MQKIGWGWQYATYDIGNGRVLKRYHGRILGYWYIFRRLFLQRKYSDCVNIPRYYRECEDAARASMGQLQTVGIEPWMVGNPTVVNALDYEQDMVTPLHTLFDSVSAEETKSIIDAFVAFNIMLVERGLIDRSFNIAKNFGMDKEGRIVLMDLGELKSGRKSIEKSARKRMWTKHYVLDSIQNDTARTYFVERMDAAFRLTS